MARDANPSRPRIPRTTSEAGGQASKAGWPWLSPNDGTGRTPFRLPGHLPSLKYQYDIVKFVAELDTVYLLLAVQAVSMLVVTSIYYALRLRIEAKKEQSARASFEAMVQYHSRRLDIEEAKLNLARKPQVPEHP